MALLNSTEAAERLGIKSSQLRKLLRAERIRATKIGRDWLIEESDLEAAGPRTRGYPKDRPRKQEHQELP